MRRWKGNHTRSGDGGRWGDLDGREDAERWGKEGEDEINGEARVWVTPGVNHQLRTHHSNYPPSLSLNPSLPPSPSMLPLSFPASSLFSSNPLFLSYYKFNSSFHLTRALFSSQFRTLFSIPLPFPLLFFSSFFL